MGNLSLIEFTPTLVMNMITLLALFLILKIFFFDKVRKFMLARQQKITDAFDNADRVNVEAQKKLDGYQTKLEQIQQERTDILKESKSKADTQAKQIIDEATERAHHIVMEAEKEVEREKARAMDDMKQQIALLSVYAAEQIIDKNIDANEQQHIIDGIIEEAGKSTWNH